MSMIDDDRCSESGRYVLCLSHCNMVGTDGSHQVCIAICELRLPAKLYNSSTTSFRRKVTKLEREKENAINCGY